MHGRARGRLSICACIAIAAILAAGCGNPPSTLEPRGPGAHRIASLWWLMFVASTVVVLVVGALLLYAVVKRRRLEFASVVARFDQWKDRRKLSDLFFLFALACGVSGVALSVAFS